MLVPVPVRTGTSSDEGLTLETSAHNHFHGVKLIHINLKLIHYMYQRKVDVGVLNAVKNVLAGTDVSSVMTLLHWAFFYATCLATIKA